MNDLKFPSFRILLGGLYALLYLLGAIGLARAETVDASSRVPGEKWSLFAKPEAAGFSSARLQEAADDCQRSGVTGALVVYDGAILFRFGDIETRFMCHSVRKSIMSALVGIYVREGDIALNETLEELNVDDQFGLTSEEKQATVRDLLQSRSGVYHPAAYETDKMKKNRPERGQFKPGTHWWYNNWDFNTLLTIFENKTGERFFDAFREKIATPLDLQDFRMRDGYYHLEPQHSMHAAYPFRLSARDMARFGLLMANGGRWGDRQIVPSEWVDESTRQHSPIESSNGYQGYGFMWWVARLRGERMFSALGNGNHSIDVIPGRKLVFVFRPDTFRYESIKRSDRWRIIRKIVDAQTSDPASDPELISLPTVNTSPEPVALPREYFDQFPITLRRQLPRRVPPVKIDLVGETLVLYMRPPPALNLDMIPVANDRFFVEGFNEYCVIQRDAANQPIKLLFPLDLIRHSEALQAEVKADEAAEALALAERLFPDSEAVKRARRKAEN